MTRTNEECQRCVFGRWTINGRYCRKQQLLVEYAPYPPCHDKW